MTVTVDAATTLPPHAYLPALRSGRAARRQRRPAGGVLADGSDPRGTGNRRSDGMAAHRRRHQARSVRQDRAPSRGGVGIDTALWSIEGTVRSADPHQGEPGSQRARRSRPPDSRCCSAGPGSSRRSSRRASACLVMNSPGYIEGKTSPPASLMVRMSRLSDRFAKMKAHRTGRPSLSQPRCSARVDRCHVVDEPAPAVLGQRDAQGQYRDVGRLDPARSEFRA